MANPVLQVGWTYTLHHTQTPNEAFNPVYHLSGSSADSKTMSYQACTAAEYKSVVGSTQIWVVHHNSGVPVKGTPKKK